MQTQLYTKVKVFVNGSPLSEEADVRLSRHSGLNPVHTIAGFKGFSTGSPFLEIDVTNAVPNADFEYDPGADQENPNFVQITLQAAGRTLTSVGGIMGDDLSWSVNAESKLAFKFYGEFAQWL